MDVEDAFRAHHDALFRYLARQCGDVHLARDAVQESFLRLQERPPQRGAGLRAWLFTTGLNVIRDERRMAANRERLIEAAGARIPGPSPIESADQRLERLETRERVRTALAGLRERERTALLMREEGFKHREIAEALGTTTGSVGTLLARAMDKLAVAMDTVQEP
jgi:RNA polymerase sigma factor (sigma-70 family)